VCPKKTGENDQKCKRLAGKPEGGGREGRVKGGRQRGIRGGTSCSGPGRRKKEKTKKEDIELGLQKKKHHVLMEKPENDKRSRGSVGRLQTVL